MTASGDSAAGERHAVPTLAGGDDAEALELQRVPQPHDDVGLVVDDQDGLLPGGHRWAN